MIFLKQIQLAQFKNYRQRQFDFSQNIIGITGPNGTGKTNLLDAIYYLCYTKSYFSNTDLPNIFYNANGFRIEGLFEQDNKTEKISCILRQGSKKELKRNGVDYERLSEHIGLLPAVMIAPDDSQLISGGSEQRRKFMDAMLSLLNHEYLDHLLAYQKILQQRNSLLRKLAEEQRTPGSLLEVLDEQLAAHGTYIYISRKKFLEDFIPVVQDLYDYISASHEKVAIEYNSQLNENNFAELLIQRRQKDLILQRTTGGIHRDDLQLLLDGHVLKTSGSQGQRKSFLFALKLAKYQVIRDERQTAPLLLLDDIFEKLDEQRISRLIKLVNSSDFGQVFITDTEKERLIKAFASGKDQLQVIELVEKG